MVEVGDLKKFELFGVLSEKQLEKIARITEKKSFKKGAHIYEKGDRAKEMHVVLNGQNPYGYYCFTGIEAFVYEP